MADTTTDELDKRHFVRPEQRIEIKTPDVYKFNLISRGREKKIHIGGQMSIAKKTSTTWEDVIISTLFPNIKQQLRDCHFCWHSRLGSP